MCALAEEVRDMDEIRESESGRESETSSAGEELSFFQFSVFGFVPLENCWFLIVGDVV